MSTINWVILSLALLVLYLLLTPASNSNHIDPSFRQIVHASSSLCAYPNRIALALSPSFRQEVTTSCAQECLADENCKYAISSGSSCQMYDALPPFEDGMFTGPWDVREEESSWGKPEAAGCIVDPNPKLSTPMQKPTVSAGPNPGEVTVSFIPLVGASNYIVLANPVTTFQRVEGSSSPLIFKNLDPSREYTFRVIGENSSGLSPPSPASNPVRPKA